jgi:hypothetical protein
VGHARRRARVRVERKLEAWSEIAQAVGLAGSRVMSALVDVWGWRARCGEPAAPEDDPGELLRRLEAAGHRLRGTVMDLSWTCRPPTVTRRFGVAPGVSQISLSPVHLPGGSHSQMEGFQAEDRHDPLPHIGPCATVLK